MAPDHEPKVRKHLVDSHIEYYVLIIANNEIVNIEQFHQTYFNFYSEFKTCPNTIARPMIPTL